MAKTLLTGATGFLGQFILQSLLESGREVRALVRHPEKRDLPWRKLVEVVPGDITDLLALEKAIEGVQEVVHCAAMVSFQKKDHALMRRINVQGTAHVVDLALHYEVERLVHVSSIASIGESATGFVVDEQSPWNPKQAKSMYAKTKYQAELEVFRGIAEGLSAVMVNPGLILGPAQHWHAGTPQLFKRIYEGLRFLTRGSNALVGARDVAEACVRLLDHRNPVGERYILAADNWDYARLFGSIAKHLGKPAPNLFIPRSLALIGGWAVERIATLTGKPTSLTLESMRSSGSRWEYDGTKITELGFTYTPIEQVLQTTAEAYLTHLQQS